MIEQCPLVVLRHRKDVGTEILPQCQAQCGELMEVVSLANNGEVDNYGVNDTCNALVEFSRDSLTLGDTALRHYHVVDRCSADECGRQEVQETTYTFTCPYSE